MNMRPTYRIISLLLALILLVQTVPVTARGAEETTQEPAVSAAPSEPAPESAAVLAEGQIVEEITQSRSRYSKEFRLSNGLHMAVVYPEPVHYESGGTWQDIDNTLKASGTAYTNTAGEWDISLPQTLDGASAVQVSRDGHTLRFRLAGALHGEKRATAGLLTAEKEETTIQSAGRAQGQIQRVDIQQARDAAQHPETVPEKLRSRLHYGDIYPNTDIVYDLTGGQLKESIVMDSYTPGLLGYGYTLETGDMIPVLAEDGSVTLYSEQTPVLFMPAPYLVDGAGVYSFDVDVELVGKAGVYGLTYLLPEAWLAEESRQWPVILDPIISTESNYTNTEDQNVYENTSIYTTPAAGMVTCGYDPTCRAIRFYMRYNQLPAITSSDVILDASITLYAQERANTANIQVHEVTGTWSAGNLNWTNQPSFRAAASDFANCTIAGSTNSYFSWEITDIVQSWYRGSNNGMVFKMSDQAEAARQNGWVRFYSSNFNVACMPMLTILFRNNNGLESYWDYTSASAGRAGTGSVNTYTGNLVWVRGDMGFGGSRMPVSISHVYNLNDVITPADSNNSNDSGGNGFGMGMGWRTNFNQLLYRWVLDGNQTAYYVWEDGDGTDHYFLAGSDGVLRDEDGLELTLTTNGTGTEVYRITDKYGNSTYFDSYGRLTKISNNQATKSHITVAYTTATGRLISTVTDGAGRVYSFAYTNGLLNRISYLGTGSTALHYVDYQYTGSLLTRAVDRDGGASVYTYNTTGLLTSAQDADGYRINLGYNTVSHSWQPYRVLSITQSHNGTTGGGMSFAYSHNQTILTDHNGNREILQFNDYGNLICVQDGEGRAQFAQYAFQNREDAANNTDTTARTNQLRLASDLQYTVANLMPDNNMRFTSLSWSPYGYAEKELTTSRCYADLSALRVTAYGTHAIAGSGVSGGSFDLAPGQTHTFSCYVASSACAVYLEASGSDRDVRSSTQPLDDEWHRLQVSYTNHTNATCQVYYNVQTDDDGEFYMDCPQLELAPTSSRYNMINNGDFRHSITDHQWTETGFESTDGVTILTSSAVPQLDRHVMMVKGSPTAQKRLTQTVLTDGNPGDYYTLCGWAKGNSAALDAFDTNPRAFAMEAVILYADGTRSKPFTAQFNPDSDEWQFAAVGIVAEKDFWKIEVTLIYDYNINTVYFDGIQLYKDGLGDQYTYDASGNVTKILAANGKETTRQYTNNNLTREVLTSGAVLTYTYDAYHNVKTAATEEGLVYTFGYDTWGNNTAVSIGDGTSTMTATAAYSADGNRLERTTDAMGEITRYGYNAQTNLLEWVQYPEDTEATRTAYSYDTMYRLASAAATTDTGTALGVSYTYTDDLLTRVESPGTAYDFAYGAFSLASSVKIGGRTLASYSYTNDRNFYLSALDYGNGDRVQYTYDDLGRVTSATYESGDTVQYTYDNSGRLATVTDSGSGTESTTGYDYIDRLSVYTERRDGLELTLSYSYYVSNRKLKTLLENINGKDRGASYIYDDDERLTSYQKANGKRAYTYDAFDRMASYVTSHKNSGGTFDTVLSTVYTFASSAVSSTSGRIASLRQTATGYDVTTAYTYDGNGNILTVSDGTNTTSYVYDSAGQLLRENNQAGGFTHVWTYSASGNILSRTEYAYTTGELGTPTDTVTYTYGDTEWGDLLTAYDGVNISYDAIGNPASDGTWSYTWEHGRELASMTKADNSQTWTHTYDANGLRTSRTNGTTTYNYLYYGGLLQYMEKDGSKLYFTHAPDGTPMGVLYQNTAYFYITNLQGDVVGIVNQTGTPVVAYTYDAWGNPLTCTGTLADTLGAVNPLRYRGYVYDTETGLYYLQSRYYNPETGRFLNADSYASTSQGFMGSNMFAYCLNNPGSFVDSEGERAVVRSNGFIGGTSLAEYEYKDYGAKEPPKTDLRDVTNELDRALTKEAIRARLASKGTKMWLGYSVVSMGLLYYDFYRIVNHGAKWDIKRENVWENTIGTDFPGRDAVVKYSGKTMTAEELGNYTYGYLGCAYGIPLWHLIPGSYYAAGFPLGGDKLTNEITDWYYINEGYWAAQADMYGGLWP